MSDSPFIGNRRDSAAPPVPGRAMHRCLIVHNEMEQRLRLAELVRRACPGIVADTVTAESYAGLSPARLGSYVAVLFIVEFLRPSVPGDPLIEISRLARRAPRIPIVVFGHGGDERWAVRSIKAGAVDYWPIHSVNVAELSQVLSDVLVAARKASVMDVAKPTERRHQPSIAGYRLVKTIAQSDAATVYLAYHEDYARPLALKVHALKGRRRGSDDDRQRFASECKLLSGLNHRAIADVLEFGMTDEFLYLALEYFPCGSLRERLRNPLKEADSRHYAKQIAEALHIVHCAKIVHGDLKPSNVMLTDANRVVLIDFGSARAQLVGGQEARTESITGTPYYACPEQISGRELDARSDLYSLGVMLFEMLAGAPPFGGKSLKEIFAAHQSASVPRLQAASSRYQPLIDRLLAKNPADRYPSAVAFLDALNALDQSTPTPARTADAIGASLS